MADSQERDADGMQAVNQLIEVLPQFLITLHRLTFFLRIQEAPDPRAGGFHTAVSDPTAP
ncbi:MAG TPA: hypothetical protein PK614_04420 [Nitrospira sp.]|nr:hypothetical protein [Nitrospira sp.]